MNQRNNYKLSVIIPAYNESGCIEKSLVQLKEYLDNCSLAHEIIVVDDGSDDNTREIIAETNIALLNPVRQNKGKGYSVREGIALSEGEYILVMDADMSTDISALDKMLKSINTYDIVVGSRRILSNTDKYVYVPFYRKVLGEMGHRLINFVLPQIRDTQCGFKMYKREIANQLFSKQLINAYMYDFEVLYIASKSQYLIKEISVNWVFVCSSKVRFSDYFVALLDFFKVLMYYKTGRYKNGTE